MTAAPPAAKRPRMALAFVHRITTVLAIIRKTLTHPALALGSTIIWGLVEFVALNRARRSGR